MKERPILFSAPMVRAILEGKKTQTRRIVKLPSPDGEVYVDPGGTIFGPGPYVKNYPAGPSDQREPMHPRIRCPYGYPGDRLYVREAWRSWTRSCVDEDTDDDHECGEHCNQTYLAFRATPRTGFRPVPDRAAITYLDESTPIESNRDLLGPWKPGIHLRRDWARIWLEIISVRVERLHAITGRDVLAEGVDNGKSNPTQGERWENMQRLAFESLWSEINGAASWNANPWVWVVEFKRLEGR